MDVKKLFNPTTRSLYCPDCNHSIPLSESDIRTLAGILMGSCTSERKSQASAQNGKLGGRFKADNPKQGGIIAPATASRYVKKGRAEYGNYLRGDELQKVWNQIYDGGNSQELLDNPQYDTSSNYRMVIRKDIPGRIDFYCVDYYKRRKQHD